MPAAIRVIEGTLSGRVLLLDDRPFFIGRSLEAHLTLPSEGVFERHAAVAPDGGGYRLVPLAKGGRTVLGGQPLSGPQALADGDRFRIGLHTFEFVAETSRAPVGTGSEAERRCSGCGEPLGSEAARSGRQASLAALRLGQDVVCPRCVDRRLELDVDLERYRILRKTGQNEEEVTYLARDKEDGRRVAIRILKADRQADPRVLRRFLARALVGLIVDHPHYVESLALRSERGITYTVLEQVDHALKLEAFLREQTPLKPAQAGVVVAGLASAMDFGRQHGLLVAKRKRSGVLVTREEHQVKVLAFDLTREVEESVLQTAAFKDLVARSGHEPDELVALGFPEPKDEEEARLSRLGDEYAEVHSLGRILFQLLTGQVFQPQVVPLVRATWSSRRTNGSPPPGPLAGLPLPWLRLLDRVLVPNGTRRIKTHADLQKVALETSGGAAVSS